MTVFFSFWNWPPGIITHGGFPVVPCGGRSAKHKEHLAHDASLPKALSRLLAVNLGARGPSPFSVLGSGEDTVLKFQWLCLQGWVFWTGAGWDEWRKKKENDLKASEFLKLECIVLEMQLFQPRNSFQSISSRFPPLSHLLALLWLKIKGLSTKGRTYRRVNAELFIYCLIKSQPGLLCSLPGFGFPGPIPGTGKWVHVFSMWPADAYHLLIPCLQPCWSSPCNVSLYSRYQRCISEKNPDRSLALLVLPF